MSNLNFQKNHGLIPAIIQDHNTKQVLMLGYMNKEALKITKKTKVVTFWSRSQNRLWTKGETSQNYLKVKKILTDCDQDTLLILVEPQGNTCHRGTYSCFGEETFTFKKLEKIINQRKKEMPSDSQTTSLFKKGLDRIVQKFGEEAIEVVIAAKNKNKELFKNETADLIYNLIVLLSAKETTLDEIIKTLEQRNNS